MGCAVALRCHGWPEGIAVGRNRCFFWLGLTWVALFLAGFTDVVCADPISFDMGRLMIGLLVAGVIALGILLVVYSLAVLGVELWVVRRLLGLDFGTGLKIVLLINVVSVLVGAVWTAIGGDIGWKTAWFQAQWGALAWAWVRSLIVAILVEYAVLLLALQREHSADRLLIASVAANAASYVASLLFLMVLAGLNLLTPSL